MAEITTFKTCHTINFTIMRKMHYAKPVTEIEVQAYYETHLLGMSLEGGVQPGRENFKEGIPVHGGVINNPSFVSGSGNGSYLWDEEESDF